MKDVPENVNPEVFNSPAFEIAKMPPVTDEDRVSLYRIYLGMGEKPYEPMQSLLEQHERDAASEDEPTATS